MDTKILISIITASASIIAATLTYLYKLLSEISGRKRQEKMFLMTIRNELIVNHALSKAVEKDTRTLGFKFIDDVWSSSDTSVIYGHGIPTEKILEVYSNIQVFNILNVRYLLIKEQEDYRNKQHQLAVEHAEMVALSEKIGKEIELILSDLRI
jgi:hypothetical protein